MDNILIFSKNEEEHKEHLENMFDVLRRHKLYAKRSKCQFFGTQIEYLGHVLSGEGVSVDPKKIETVVRWSVPKDKTEVICFLGLATYMRKYVRDFLNIAAPMTDLLKGKSERITWTRDYHESFEALKKVLKEAPVLRIMDPLKGGLVLCTDANDMAISVVLMQKGRVIAYKFRKLNNAKLNYHVHEKELFAIIHALKI